MGDSIKLVNVEVNEHMKKKGFNILKTTTILPNKPTATMRNEQLTIISTTVQKIPNYDSIKELSFDEILKNIKE